MTDLALYCGLVVEKPIGVDWCRELKARQLLKLKVGEFIFFERKDGLFECGTVTALTRTFDLRSGGSRLHGIQVFVSGRTQTFTPKLIMDGVASGLYRFIDLDAAWLHYHKPTLAAVTEEVSVRSLGGGG